MLKHKNEKSSGVVRDTIIRLFYKNHRHLLYSRRQDAGFFLGTTKILGRKYYVCKSPQTDGHILIVGGTGSGKSSCVAMQSLSTWSDSIIAIDIKSEMSDYYNELLKNGEVTRPFIKFSPMEKGGWKFDPYALLRQCGEAYLVQYARELALSIIPLPPSVKDPFWVEGAQNLLTAAILYYFGIGASFSLTITGTQTTPAHELLEEIANSGNQNALMFMNNLRNLKPEVLAGIAAEMSNKIMVFATDPFISKALGDNEDGEASFTWDDMEKYNIFFCIPEDKLEQWRSVTTLMINQLFRVLERKPDMHSQQGVTVTPTLLLLDEMPRLGKLEIVNALSTLRSKKVTIAAFIQSLAHLDWIYGEHASRIIADNCSFKVFLRADDVKSQQYMSSVIGVREVTKVSHTTNYHRDYETSEERILRQHGIIQGKSSETSRGVTHSKQYESVIRPEEFGRLNDIVLVTPEGHRRINKAYHFAEERPDRMSPNNDKSRPESQNKKSFWGGLKAITHKVVDVCRGLFNFVRSALSA